MNTLSNTFINNTNNISLVQNKNIDMNDNFEDFTIDGHEFKYGLGLQTISNMYGTTIIGHSGGNPGFIHEFYFSTETNEIIIFFFNKWPDESDFQFRDKLRDILQRYRITE